MDSGLGSWRGAHGGAGELAWSLGRWVEPGMMLKGRAAESGRD
ncbi:hypothetical protein [Cohnella herbarum]|nr:hypothetical protein [Cohnella herbarum]